MHEKGLAKKEPSTQDKTAIQFLAFAVAAFPCVRSKPFVATQRKSPKRSLQTVMIAETENALSPQLLAPVMDVNVSP